MDNNKLKQYIKEVIRTEIRVNNPLKFNNKEINYEKLSNEASEKFPSRIGEPVTNNYHDYIINSYLNNKKFVEEFKENFESYSGSGESEEFFQLYNDEPYGMDDWVIDDLLIKLDL